MERSIGAAAAAVALCLTVGLCGCQPSTASRTRPIDGVTFVGDRAHPVKIFQLSADGRAAVGFVWDADKAPPAGSETLDAGMPDNGHSYRWTSAGGVRVIRTRDGRNVEVRAISADGTTAAGCFYDAAGLAHVFRWTEAGGVEDLGAPEVHLMGGICGATAAAVSADGSVILGRLGTGDSFRWTRATGIRDLHIHGDIVAASADGSTAVGLTFVDQGDDRVSSHVFRWRLVHGFEDLGAPRRAGTGVADLSVNAISADGSTIVGDYTPVGGEIRAFRWTPADGFRDLPGDGGTARAVSGDGSQVVGSIWTRGKGPHAVRWQGSGPPQPVGPPELQALAATSISADGRTIAGRAFVGKGETQAFLLEVK
jgi:uncharacterized membrane protein